MKLDLHVHTIFSDGSYTPAEVAQMAKEKGLEGIAITDHDECRGYGEIAKDPPKGISVFPGIEFSAKHNGEIHVLGLLIDWQDPALLAHVEKAAKARQRRAEKMLEKFKEAGLDIHMNEVADECKGGVIGRPHFAAALVKKGHATSFKEAFTRYLTSHAPFYIALEKIDIRRAAELINGAGGKAVLAHPGFIKDNVFDDLLPKLTEMGFWGIEAYHPSHSDAQCKAFESLARQHGLYVTAGSDFHGSVKPRISIGQEQRGGKYLEESMEVLFGD